MTDSKSAAGAESTGSTKLQLPSTDHRGSSLTDAGSGSSQGHSVPISDRPTAISKEPVIQENSLSLAALVRSLVGTKLMHFRVDEFVGGGGMGAVFRGQDLSLGRTVAIKVLSQERLDDEMVRRFGHEARSAARLDHPGIPHVYFVGEDAGWHFIVFEFVEGTNIRDLVQKLGPLEIRDAVTYLADVAEALQHASERDVVHRDVKPSNVLVTNDGQAVLVDMGLARSDQIQSTAADLTATGVTLGTFDYISPEQARDPRNADTRSDIYSLGCTLYYMLTGRPPFPEGTMLQKLLSHSSELPTAPSEYRSDVPDGLVGILARMLAKKPEHRHQDAAELLSDILLFAEEHQITLNHHRNTQIVIERKVVQATGWSQHVPWFVPLAVLVATAVTLQVWQVPASAPPGLPMEADGQEPASPPPAEVDGELDTGNASLLFLDPESFEVPLTGEDANGFGSQDRTDTDEENDEFDAATEF